MIQICHECPWSLMEKARNDWNDYDYALVHLFEKYDKYFEFFKQSLKQGRRVILDNSIFELGTAFDSDKYAEWIVKLQPQEYIIPDVLEDCNSTIDSVEEWFSTNGIDLPGKTIGVVQGKTYQELIDCYNFMSHIVDKIAISFDYSYFDITGIGDTKWERLMTGRQFFIYKLLSDGIWNHKKPHHLLGIGLPQEVVYYSTFWDKCGFDTLDTSNPIQQGLLGHKYTEHGLQTKDTTKVADSFNAVYSNDKIEIANHNVNQFRKFCGVK